MIFLRTKVTTTEIYKQKQPRVSSRLHQALLALAPSSPAVSPPQALLNETCLRKRSLSTFSCSSFSWKPPPSPRTPVLQGFSSSPSGLRPLPCSWLESSRISFPSGMKCVWWSSFQWVRKQKELFQPPFFIYLTKWLRQP